MAKKILSLYEVSQPMGYVRWTRVEATSENEAIELAKSENFWNETEPEQESQTEVELIEEIREEEEE